MMLPKPPTCQGCPLYATGQGYVPDQLVEGSPLAIVMQNPGESEEQGLRVVDWAGRTAIKEPAPVRPAIGPTGYIMDKVYLPLTGYRREDVSVLNILKCRLHVGGKATNDMPTGEVWKAAVKQCMRSHFRLPQGVKLILAQGAHAWRALGGPEPLTDWRGFLSPKLYQEIPVYATLHLADLNHEPKAEMWTKLDWRKVPRILKGGWPAPLPEMGHPATVTEWLYDVDDYLVIDTEYNPETGELWLLGLASPTQNETHQVEWHKTPAWRKEMIVKAIKGLAAKLPVVFHNALADVLILERNCGLGWEDFPYLEDTMQAHAVLWCEMPHDLEFLSSIYGKYPKLKHLRHSDPLLYNQGDVLETLSVWEALRGELKVDPQSEKVYRTQLALLPIVAESMQRGIAVNTRRVEERIRGYEAKVQEATQLAHAYCGWPINLSSDDQLSHWCYEVEGMAVQKGRKPRKPAKGKRKGNTINQDARAVLRAKLLPFEAEEDENPTLEYILGRIEAGGHPLLEAKHLQGNADQCLKNYLYPLVEG